MKNILPFKSDIDHKKCPLHNARPFMIVTGDHITVRCCCDAFMKKCVDEINKANDIADINSYSAWHRNPFDKSLTLNINNLSN